VKSSLIVSLFDLNIGCSNCEDLWLKLKVKENSNCIIGVIFIDIRMLTKLNLMIKCVIH